MEQGILTRFEEITRTPAEVQDCLISVLSDKVMNVPELGDGGILFARPGFNVIATANTRDKGVNEMSSALKRRFSFETVQPVGDVALEKQIILDEAGAMARSAGISAPLDEDAAALLATAYHELRQGVSAEGIRLKKPAAVMSTAEAVSVYYQTLMSAWYYGGPEQARRLDERALAENLMGAVAKESREELAAVREYFTAVVQQKAEREGGAWKRFLRGRDPSGSDPIRLVCAGALLPGAPPLPSCAWHLERAIRQYRPELILIEGPENANSLIPHPGLPTQGPPVALYYSYRDDAEACSVREKIRLAGMHRVRPPHATTLPGPVAGAGRAAPGGAAGHPGPVHGPALWGDPGGDPLRLRPAGGGGHGQLYR